MSIRLQWPAYQAGLISHTVQTTRGLVAGYLVRCTASNRALGYVWQSGNSWQWKAGEAYGERSSQEAAVRQLRDIADVGGRRRSAPVAAPSLPFEPAPAAKPAAPKPKPEPKPAPAPAPARRVVWDDSNTVDLTAAIAAQLEKHKR